MATARDTDSLLLRALRGASRDDGMLSSNLATHIGLDELALATRIDSLCAAGYDIALTSGGYRLIAAPKRLIADDLCAALPEKTTIGIGREILVFEETDSTNDLAARAGRDGIPGGLVIFAESQRAGRGQLGRKWIAPSYQALLFSVLLRPDSVPPERWPELTFCAALAVAETADEVTGHAARIKWPNDVLLGERKIAGILLERYQEPTSGFVVVGIGLNVLQREEDFPPELRERAGSLAMFAPADHSPERLRTAATVLQRLEAIISRWPNGFPDMEAACRQRGCDRPPEPGMDAPLSSVRRGK